MKICLFAGTTEGRRIAELLQGEKFLSLTICVATQYGETPLEQLEHIAVHTGRMNADEMRAFFFEENFSLVVDATHPYAEMVTENIRQAAKSCGLEYLRILRDEETGCNLDNAVCFENAQEAAEYLEGKVGRILLTTGAKELPYFRKIPREQLWVRILPSIPSIEACISEGIEPSHMIAMQGPFSEKMNRCQLEEIGAEYLVTKNSGRTGGFAEKINAAINCKVTAVVIGRKTEQQGMSAEDAVEYIKCFRKEKGQEAAEKENSKEIFVRVSIVGVGVGNRNCMTLEAQKVIRDAEILLGAGRLLEGYPDKKKIAEIHSDRIRIPIEREIEKRKKTSNAHPADVAVLVSGDPGFYSAAKKIKEVLKEVEGCEVTCIPGVGCISYFAAKLQIPWEDCTLVSLHGREQNLLHAVRTDRRVLVLTGGKHTVTAICRRLTENGFENVRVTVGEKLSYPEEKIFSGSALELAEKEFGPLNVMLIENPKAVKNLQVGIADEEFIRGEVPMTKREIRAVTMSYLQPDADSVIYDIGAGTGSVSVECALTAFRGRVYAVEKNSGAVALIGQNGKKFALENLILVEGEAPKALENLERPTHVFIGGSSGNLRAILETVLKKNPKAVIVLNTVTLETLSEAVICAKELGFDESEFTQIDISRGKVVGKYHMMTALNPVTVIRLQRKRG